MCTLLKMMFVITESKVEAPPALLMGLPLCPDSPASAAAACRTGPRTLSQSHRNGAASPQPGSGTPPTWFGWSVMIFLLLSGDSRRRSAGIRRPGRLHTDYRHSLDLQNPLPPPFLQSSSAATSTTSTSIGSPVPATQPKVSGQPRGRIWLKLIAVGRRYMQRARSTALLLQLKNRCQRKGRLIMSKTAVIDAEVPASAPAGEPAATGSHQVCVRRARLHP